jgi:hypothetical protein
MKTSISDLETLYGDIVAVQNAAARSERMASRGRVAPVLLVRVVSCSKPPEEPGQTFERTQQADGRGDIEAAAFRRKRRRRSLDHDRRTIAEFSTGSSDGPRGEVDSRSESDRRGSRRC